MGQTISQAELGRQSMFARAVYARLGVVSVVAWAGAWAVAVPEPLRRMVLVSDHDIRGVTLVGMGLAAAPLVIWALSRVLVRKPAPLLGAALLWPFAFLCGADANILFQAATGNSLASLFCILAIGFAALNRITRWTSSRASILVNFLTLSLVGEGVAFLFDRVLTQWVHAEVDMWGVMIAALVMMFAAPRINGLWTALHATTKWNALVDFAVMNVLTMTETQFALARASAATAAGASEGLSLLGPNAHGSPNTQSQAPVLALEDQT